MGPLQVLEDTFAAQNFHVLGFFSNDFSNQAGTVDEINACNALHSVTFPEFSIEHVKNSASPPYVPQPVFDWLLTQPNPGQPASLTPDWNFHKYLIARDGTLVEHFNAPVWPGDNPNDPNDSFDTSPIVIAIKAELAKPAP